MKTLFFIILATLVMFSSCEKNLTQSNERENEMKELNDGLKISGMIDIIIRRANGDIERKHYPHNIISSGLKEKVNDIFLVNTDFALNNLFVANDYPPAAGKDGIAVTMSGNDRSMISTTSEPSSTSIKITGTFTGTAGTITTIRVGFDWNGVTDEFNTEYATPTSWDSQVLASADSLTIEWTITVGA